VVLRDDELAAVAPGLLPDDAQLTRLEDWVRRHFRDTLAPGDLADPALLEESRRALDELTELLGVGPLYDFQR
jgi:succinylarginine dihydrolase